MTLAARIGGEGWKRRSAGEVGSQLAVVVGTRKSTSVIQRNPSMKRGRSNRPDEIRRVHEVGHELQVEGSLGQILAVMGELKLLDGFDDGLGERLRVLLLHHRLHFGSIHFFRRWIVLLVLVKDDLRKTFERVTTCLTAQIGRWEVREKAVKSSAA